MEGHFNYGREAKCNMRENVPLEKVIADYQRIFYFFGPAIVLSHIRLESDTFQSQKVTSQETTLV